MSKEFNIIGIVGYGKIGQIYRKIFDELTAHFLIVDPKMDEDRENYIYSALEDVPEEVFRHVQAWNICVPTENHLEILSEVLSRNPRAWVIIEKPICLSFEIDSFRALLIRYPDAHIVGNEQYNDSLAINELKDFLTKTGISRPELIRIEFSKDRRPDIAAGRFVDLHYGLLGYEWVHMLAILRNLLGEKWSEYAYAPSRIWPTFDAVQFVSEIEEHTVMSSGTKIELRSSMIGNYGYESFLPVDQLVQHRYVEVRSGSLRFMLQMEPRFKTQTTGGLFENLFRIEEGDSVLRESTIHDPSMPRFLQSTLRHLYEHAESPIEIDWPFMERIISMRQLLRDHYNQNKPGAREQIKAELLYQVR